MAAATGLAPRALAAQDGGKDDGEGLDRVWRIEGLHTGFCVQLLLDPAKLDVTLPQGARPLRADADDSLSPVLRTVIANQPDVAGWIPSKICMYFMKTVRVGSVRVSERERSKAPMVGVWILAAADSAGGRRRDVVLRLFTNAGRLERAGKVSGIDLQKIRSEVRSIPSDDEDPSAAAIGVRYQVRLDKTLLIWEGRRVDDSTRAGRPVTAQWRAETKRRGPVTARLVLTPEWTQAMAGSLRVEGKGDFADAVKASPIRFVGPALLGGGGELAFRR